VGVSRDQGLPKFFRYPLLSQERVKLRTSNFVGTVMGSIGTKAHENVGNRSRGLSQRVPNIFQGIFRAPMYRAHCAVIFAIAQLSCFSARDAFSMGGINVQTLQLLNDASLTAQTRDNVKTLCQK